MRKVQAFLLSGSAFVLGFLATILVLDFSIKGNFTVDGEQVSDSARVMLAIGGLVLFAMSVNCFMLTSFVYADSIPSIGPGYHRFVNGVCRCGHKTSDDPERCPLA